MNGFHAGSAYATAISRSGDQRAISLLQGCIPADESCRQGWSAGHSADFFDLHPHDRADINFDQGLEMFLSQGSCIIFAALKCEPGELTHAPVLQFRCLCSPTPVVALFRQIHGTEFDTEFLLVVMIAPHPSSTSASSEMHATVVPVSNGADNQCSFLVLFSVLSVV